MALRPISTSYGPGGSRRSSETPTGYNAAADLIGAKSRRRTRHKAAFIDDRGRYSFAEIAERVSRFANLVRRLGIHPEQRILLCLHDTIDFPTALPRRDQGRRRSGCAQHPALCRRVRLHGADTAPEPSSSPRHCCRSLMLHWPCYRGLGRRWLSLAATRRITHWRDTRRSATASDTARPILTKPVLLAPTSWAQRGGPRAPCREYPFEPDANGRALCRPGARHRRE